MLWFNYLKNKFIKIKISFRQKILYIFKILNEREEKEGKKGERGGRGERERERERERETLMFEMM